MAKQLEALRKENEALKIKVQLRGKQEAGTRGEGDADMEDAGEGDDTNVPISALINTTTALGAVGAPQGEIDKYQAMLDARRLASGRRNVRRHAADHGLHRVLCLGQTRACGAGDDADRATVTAWQ